jgi:hypothetical protein
MPTGLSEFPIKSKLNFLKASRLRFRRVGGKPKSDKKYQEIRYISRAQMFGYLSFLNPDSPDDQIYTKLTLRVSVSNFPNSSFGEFIGTASPTGGVVNNPITWYPNESTHTANVTALFGSPSTIAKTATNMVQTFTDAFTGATVGQQVWTLSDPVTIRDWQHRMVDNLVFLKAKVLADQATSIAAGSITFEDTWDSVWLIDVDRSIQGFPDANVKSYSGGLVSANPPTGNLPPIAGRILQIERGLNTDGDDTFIDLVGVQGGHYYPGTKLANRRDLFTPTMPMIQYGYPDVAYTTKETLLCSQASHRIQVPICKALLNGKLGPVERLYFANDFGQPVSVDMGLPAVTSYGTTVGFSSSPNAPGEVPIDTPCPALSIGEFWDHGAADDYWEFQLANNDPATCINGYEIPDKCGAPPDGAPTA